MILTPDELHAIQRQAVEEYPHESCGIVLVRGSERRLERCRNDQNAKHAEDPQRYPRDARTAYNISGADLLRVGHLESEGFTVAVIYHSHVDVGAYFSETDRRSALMSGYLQPTYVVTSVVGGVVEATAAFRWNENQRDFVPVDMSVMGGPAAS